MSKACLALALLVAGCGSSDSQPGGNAGNGGGGTGGSAGGSTGGSGGITTGCNASVVLLDKDADPEKTGPAPVGARTVQLGKLTVEVWYPAPAGSDQGNTPKTYDLRSWLPESEKTKIPDADNPWQSSASFPDLPLDTEHGPYPAIVFVHGTAGFRTQSLHHMEHWASRGFVVLAADHPGLYLGDMLDFQLQRDLPADLDALVSALAVPAGDLAFLSGHVDATHLGMVGHSAGGGAITNRGNDARVLIPIAAGGTQAGSSLESTLVMGGQADKVVDYANTVTGYEGSPPKKRLVGLAKAGHLFPSGLCWLENSKGENILEVAQKYQVKNATLAGALFDCPADQLSEADARAIVDYATSAALEEALECKQGDPFADLSTRFPAVAELRHDP